MLDTVGPQEERMRALTTEEAAPRRRVIYVGRAAEPSTTGVDLLDGRVLAEHHPGTIDHVSDDGQVYVRFVGLEDEPLSDSTWVPGASGRYPALVLVDPEEWEAAVVSSSWAAAFRA
jgi:hypothetical protein